MNDEMLHVILQIYRFHNGIHKNLYLNSTKLSTWSLFIDWHTYILDASSFHMSIFIDIIKFERGSLTM